MTKIEIRQAVVDRARAQKGKPYNFGVEVSLKDNNPSAFDCSELMEWIFAINNLPFPDGAVNQFAYCKKGTIPLPADLGFLHYPSQKTKKMVWHVGLLTEHKTVIHASFSRKKVIEEGLDFFEKHIGWLGWKTHPHLA